MALTIDAHQNGIGPGKLDMTPELRNGLMTVRQLPILVFEHAEFLSYGRTQYDSAEKYYRRAMEVRTSPRAVRVAATGRDRRLTPRVRRPRRCRTQTSPRNVQYVMGYAKFLYYCLMSVDEAKAQFALAAELIDNGTAVTNNYLHMNTHAGAAGDAGAGPADGDISDPSVYAEVYCEYGTFLLKTVDRRMMEQDLTNDTRVALAAVLYNKAYDHDKYANCLIEMYRLIGLYRPDLKKIKASTTATSTRRSTTGG